MRNNSRILAVVSDGTLFGKLQSLISRSIFDMNRVPSGTGALILAGNLQYDLILLESPLPDLDLQDFLAAIRTLDCPCAGSAVLVLHRADELHLTDSLRSDLVAVLPADSTDLEIQRTLSSLLGVAARASGRLLVQVEVETGDREASRLLQSENISETGLLLRGGTRLEAGTRLSLCFQLPEDGSPIEATAEVVRHAAPPHEPVAGIAARFLDIAGDGRERLRSFVDRAAAERSEGQEDPDAETLSAATLLG